MGLYSPWPLVAAGAVLVGLVPLIKAYVRIILHGEEES